MKGKMLCVIYCVLSNLTVILFETTVLWLHPGEGTAQINGAEEEMDGGTKAAAASAADAGSPPAPARCGAGKMCSRGRAWIPSPPLRRCLLTHKFILSRGSLGRGSAVVRLLSSPRAGKRLLPQVGGGARALTAQLTHEQ